ncbi:MAG: hypothetical protein ACRDAU_06495 [Clostridium sp.]
MDKILFEFDFKFTNTDISKISTFISDYYKNSQTVKKVRNTKYGLLFSFIYFILLDFSYLSKKQFDTSSLVALITTILLLIVFFLLKNPIKRFNFYLKKNFNTNLVQVSITDSNLYLEVSSFKETFPLNSLIDILFYDNSLILIFKSKPLPLIIPKNNANFNEIMDFFKIKKST